VEKGVEDNYRKWVEPWVDHEAFELEMGGNLGGDLEVVWRTFLQIGLEGLECVVWLQKQVGGSMRCCVLPESSDGLIAYVVSKERIIASASQAEELTLQAEEDC
jgi:hypothetical protein